MKEFEFEVLDKVAYIASELETKGHIEISKKTKLNNYVNYEITNVSYSKEDGWMVYFHNPHTNHSCNYFRVEDLDIECDDKSHHLVLDKID